MTAVWSLIKREVGLCWRRGGESVQAIIFFVLAVSLFPFGVGPEPELLHTIAPGVIWVCALLASMLSVPSMYRDDFQDGSLAQLKLLFLSPEALILTKILAHWLTTGFLLLLTSPLLALMFGLEISETANLMMGLAAGTLILSLLGSLGGLLILGIREGAGVLTSLLLLPLAIPVIIFGVSSAADTQAAPDALLMLTGLLFLLFPLSLYGSRYILNHISW